MVIGTFKSKEQIKAEQYMTDELIKAVELKVPKTEVNAILLTANIRSAVNLLIDKPMDMSLSYFPLCRVTHTLEDYLGGAAMLSEMEINHQDFTVDLREGSVYIAVNEKFGILVANENVELEIESVDNLSLNDMSLRVSDLYRHGDDGVGFVGGVRNVALYLVYKDLFTIVDHVIDDNNYTVGETLPDTYSIDYLANNVIYSLNTNDSLYVVETSSKSLLKETLALFYRANPVHGYTQLGLEAAIQNEVVRIGSRNIVREIENTDVDLYGRIYTYYVDPNTAELISKLITINEDKNITFFKPEGDTYRLSDGQELDIEK